METLQQEIRQCIAARAYQLYKESGYQDGNDERNWRQAESDVLQRDIEVRESGTWLALSAILPDFSAQDVQIGVDPSRVLVKAERQPSLQEPRENAAQSAEHKKFFWAADLPIEVDPSTTTASLKNCKLSLMLKKRKDSLTSVFASYWAS
jgi:HSP20 family molecular chaperone IbpA